MIRRRIIGRISLLQLLPLMLLLIPLMKVKSLLGRWLPAWSPICFTVLSAGPQFTWQTRHVNVIASLNTLPMLKHNRRHPGATSAGVLAGCAEDGFGKIFTHTHTPPPRQTEAALVFKKTLSGACLAPLPHSRCFKMLNTQLPMSVTFSDRILSRLVSSF